MKLGIGVTMWRGETHSQVNHALLTLDGVLEEILPVPTGVPQPFPGCNVCRADQKFRALF